MDIPILIKALILGIVEGLTEFLPISSTGHLILVGDLLGFNDEKGKTFEIIIQFAAILAVCWEYRGKIIEVLVGLPSRPDAQRFVVNLFVAFLPAAALGLLFASKIKAHLFSPVPVALAFIIGGFVILWAERRTHLVTVETMDDLRWQDALKVGLAQCFALIPGTSRSGATIIGGLLFGLSRKAATEFSFFLAIPTLFAATIYELYKYRALLRAGIGPNQRRLGRFVHKRLHAVRALLLYQPTRFHRIRLVSNRFWLTGVGDCLLGCCGLVEQLTIRATCARLLAHSSKTSMQRCGAAGRFCVDVGGRRILKKKML
jgi:undecaprenyl-diphosphatase